MKKSILLLTAMLMLVVCGRAMAFTVELDPITPLNNYISLGEWDTDDDFENWTTHLVNDAAVYDGSLTGRVIGADMNISLDVSGLPNNDVRVKNVFITGSVYEIRMRFDPFTENTRSEFFPTMDGTFKIPPITFASNSDPALPDVENDGLFHVYRITFDTNDTFYLGELDGIRFDALSDATSNETFEVDYFRIANTDVVPTPPQLPYTVEFDPITPLDNYISLGEWNTNEDFEDWLPNAHITDPAVYDGNITGRVEDIDMNISLPVSSLPLPDVRVANVFITGSVYEIRLRFDQFTENQRSEFFSTMDGIFKTPAIKFASNSDPALPDVEGDGLFHVYRITLVSNFYIGRLDSIRFDILADAAVIGETFEVDYFRIANVITNVPYVNPITVDGEPISNYTSLAEWNTDGDLENWLLSSITNETVSGGIFSGEPTTGDPWFYKSNGTGLPEVDLFYSPYAEFRLKQAASINNSEIEIFFGTTNNPGLSGERRVNIPSIDIPHDGEFHIYRYKMSDHSEWNGILEGFRIDPYTVVTTERFEIDYIRVGDLIPEPSLFLGIVLVLCFVKFNHIYET